MIYCKVNKVFKVKLWNSAAEAGYLFRREGSVSRRIEVDRKVAATRSPRDRPVVIIDYEVELKFPGRILCIEVPVVNFHSELHIHILDF